MAKGLGLALMGFVLVAVLAIVGSRMWMAEGSRDFPKGGSESPVRPFSNDTLGFTATATATGESTKSSASQFSSKKKSGASNQKKKKPKEESQVNKTPKNQKVKNAKPMTSGGEENEQQVYTPDPFAALKASNKNG